MHFDIDTIEETIPALKTQYQIRTDAIIPRASKEAPTTRQLYLIREAYLHINELLQIIQQQKGSQ